MKPYTSAIIGLGNIACKFQAQPLEPSLCLTHAASYQNNPDTTLAAGCAPDATDRDLFQKQYGLPVFEQAIDMLREIKPQIVSICSPSEYHYQDIRLCLNENVPMIWLEKPPVLTLAELDECIQQLANTPTRIVVNYMRRYSKCYTSLKKVYETQSLGTTHAITFNYSRGLEANGSHLLDWLAFLFNDKNLDIDIRLLSTSQTNPSFMIERDHSPIIIFNGLDLPYHTNDIIFTCEKGRVSVLSGGQESRIESASPNDWYPGFFHLKPSSNDLLDDLDMEDALPHALKDLIQAHENEGNPLSNLNTSRFASSSLQTIKNLLSKSHE